MRYINLILSLLAVTTIASCSYLYGDQGVIQNRDTDYLKAKSIPPLHIPPGLSSSTIEAHYPVSEKSYPPGTERVNLTPPELMKS